MLTLAPLEKDKIYKILFVYKVPVDGIEDLEDMYTEHHYLTAQNSFIISNKEGVSALHKKIVLFHVIMTLNYNIDDY